MIHRRVSRGILNLKREIKIKIKGEGEKNIQHQVPDQVRYHHPHRVGRLQHLLKVQRKVHADIIEELRLRSRK